jgi:hypothetical protein
MVMVDMIKGIIRDVIVGSLSTSHLVVIGKSKYHSKPKVISPLYLYNHIYIISKPCKGKMSKGNNYCEFFNFF